MRMLACLKASVRAFRWKKPYYLSFCQYSWFAYRLVIVDCKWVTFWWTFMIWNVFSFRFSKISEFTWWARPPISDFDGGSCSLKCLKVLTYKFLPYVIKIWGLIEKDSLAVLFPVFLAAVILVCDSWVEIIQLKKHVVINANACFLSRRGVW